MDLDTIISYAIVLIIVLIVSLIYGHESPKQESNETEEDYQKRLNNYNCTYGGNRNMLLAGLTLSVGVYWYRMLKDKGLKTGGATADMGSDEPNLYKSSPAPADVTEATNAAEDVVSDMEK